MSAADYFRRWPLPRCYGVDITYDDIDIDIIITLLLLQDADDAMRERQQRAR